MVGGYIELLRMHWDLTRAIQTSLLYLVRVNALPYCPDTQPATLVVRFQANDGQRSALSAVLRVNIGLGKVRYLDTVT